MFAILTNLLPPQTHPRARSTVTGSTEYSGTRPPARATGPAGTGQPPSSSVSGACSTTRRHTPVTGLRTWPGVRSILCAKTTLTATSPLVNPVTDIGPAREDILVSSVAPLCSSSTRTGGGASPHLLKTAKFLQPKHLHQARRTLTLAPAAEEAQDQEADNSHPTPGEEEDRDGNKKAPQDGHNPLNP